MSPASVPRAPGSTRPSPVPTADSAARPPSAAARSPLPVPTHAARESASVAVPVHPVRDSASVPVPVRTGRPPTSTVAVPSHSSRPPSATTPPSHSPRPTSSPATVESESPVREQLRVSVSVPPTIRRESVSVGALPVGRSVAVSRVEVGPQSFPKSTSAPVVGSSVPIRTGLRRVGRPLRVSDLG